MAIYASKKNICPKKIILTFAPCGRAKTMQFIKWLGMSVPATVEARILGAQSPVKESELILKEILTVILERTGGAGVPLGLNVESLSIFKEEIDAAHELFQTLQVTLLNNRGSPWAVRWFCVRRSLILKESSDTSLKGKIEEEEEASVEKVQPSSALAVALEPKVTVSADPVAGPVAEHLKSETSLSSFSTVALVLAAGFVGVVIGRSTGSHK